jgi:hypothetical protein
MRLRRWIATSGCALLAMTRKSHREGRNAAPSVIARAVGPWRSMYFSAPAALDCHVGLRPPRNDKDKVIARAETPPLPSSRGP